MKKIFLTGIIVLVLLISSLLIRITFNNKKEPNLIRIRYNIISNKKEKHHYSTEDGVNIGIETNSNKIILVREKETFTIFGRKLEEKEKFSKKIKRKGRYQLNFFFFQALSKGKKAKLFFKLKRNKETIKEIPLKTFNKISPFKYTLDLKKYDTLEFENRGENFAFVSQITLSPITKKPSYVFLIGVDTLRRDSLGVYGGNHQSSKNIDEFSKDAVIFENAFSTSSWTLPVFASVYTGVSPFTHKCNYMGKKIPSDFPTLFEKLREKFIIIGNTGDYFLNTRKGFSRGFDYYNEANNDGLKRTAAKDLFKKTIEIFNILYKKENLLFFLHTYQVHNPYFPEEKLAKIYYKKFPNKDFNLLFFNPMKFIRGGKELCKDVGKDRKEKIRALYEAGVYTFDYRFGEFINFLKKKNIYKNSMIILFSDHGEEFRDHNCWEHGHSLYNELIRVPLIVKLPGNKNAGKRIKYNVSLLDIYPFLLNFFNIKIPDIAEGQDLFKESKNRIIEASLFPESIRKKIPGKIALIKGKYKLIYSKDLPPNNRKFFIYPTYFKRFELYDIRKDPQERKNIFNYKEPSIKEFLKILRKRKFKDKKKKETSSKLKKRLKTIGYL